MQVVISSGHGKYVRGASGFIDEVNEARKVVEQVATDLRSSGIDTVTYHDDVSQSQSENLNRIVSFHNSKTRDLDVSVHFNAYQTTDKPMGSEVLYVTQSELANTIVDKICAASGLINRGPKKRTDLAFLNGTEEPAVLIETCFVDSRADVDIYHKSFNEICRAIAEGISGPKTEFYVAGKCSCFGGPRDTGVSPSEGLAFISSVDQKPELFLPYQPVGTTGLARRLDPRVHYVACRWNYEVTPKEMLLKKLAFVRAKKTGIGKEAFPADWGPNENTGRVADLSPGLMKALRITTDDEVDVIFPYHEEAVA